jgi:hypothetical protein
MLRVAQVSARFTLPRGAAVTFSDTLEVSLDCCVCYRCHRTVIFQVGGVEGKCTPTGHAFPGKIVAKNVGQDGPIASAVYRLEYWYEPFTDAKYPEHRKPSGRPTWGRVGFEVTCPACGQVNRQSTQTNIVRPWTCQCQCGQTLYTETAEMPELSLVEVTTGKKIP